MIEEGRNCPRCQARAGFARTTPTSLGTATTNRCAAGQVCPAPTAMRLTTASARLWAAISFRRLIGIRGRSTDTAMIGGTIGSRRVRAGALFIPPERVLWPPRCSPARGLFGGSTLPGTFRAPVEFGKRALWIPMKCARRPPRWMLHCAGVRGRAPRGGRPKPAIHSLRT
jgi:hypothetical protein